MENLQEEAFEIQLNQTALIPVYHGIGFTDAKGDVNYFAAIDADPGKTYRFKCFKIRNDGVFIHFNNGSDFALLNPYNNFYKIPNFRVNQHPIPTEYKVVLYHENRTITKQEAIGLFDQYKSTALAPKGIALPNRTGTGTIQN